MKISDKGSRVSVLMLCIRTRSRIGLRSIRTNPAVPIIFYLVAAEKNPAYFRWDFFSEYPGLKHVLLIFPVNSKPVHIQAAQRLISR
jgi:hypothetical protein